MAIDIDKLQLIKLSKIPFNTAKIVKKAKLAVYN